jgi:hypothetical protein
LGWIRELQIDTTTQAGKHVGHRGPGFAARSNGNKLHIGTLRQKAQQFDSSVSGATDNPNLDHPLTSKFFPSWYVSRRSWRNRHEATSTDEKAARRRLLASL